MRTNTRLWIVLFLVAAGVTLLVACGDSGSGSSGLPTQRPTITALPPMTPTDVPEPQSAEIDLVDWDDVGKFEAAMRPAFANDVYAWADYNRYYIEASLVFDDNGVTIIRGTERVRYTNHTQDTMDEIVFRLYSNLAAHAGRMVVYQATVEGEPVEFESVLILRLTDPDDPSKPLSENIHPLAPGDDVEITLAFSVAAERGVSASYGEFGYQDNVFSGPEWYPVLSVYEEGVGWWQELPSQNGDAVYSETGLYETFLTVPANDEREFRVALSGTEIGVEYDEDAGTKTVHYISGPMRDSLLVVGPDFGVLTKYVNEATDYVGEERSTDNDVKVNVFYWPGDEDVAEDVLQIASDSVRVYGQNFGPYPFAELDVAETFNYTGIEYPGIVVIAERNWTKGNTFLEITTAHEVGHQWWYSVIGNNQVGQPWLDESLTSYSEYVYDRNVHDTRRENLAREADVQRYNNHLRQGNPDRVLDLPVSAYVDLDYGVIIYVKGPLFYAELETMLGSDRFFKALQLYYRRHRYEVVRSRDVLEAFEDSTGEDLDQIFYETVGDFPGLDRPATCLGEARPERDPGTSTLNRRGLRWLYGTACGTGYTLPKGQTIES
jgi:hypothetical protein